MGRIEGGKKCSWCGATVFEPASKHGSWLKVASGSPGGVRIMSEYGESNVTDPTEGPGEGVQNRSGVVKADGPAICESDPDMANAHR